MPRLNKHVSLIDPETVQLLIRLLPEYSRSLRQAHTVHRASVLRSVSINTFLALGVLCGLWYLLLFFSNSHLATWQKMVAALCGVLGIVAGSFVVLTTRRDTAATYDSLSSECGRLEQLVRYASQVVEHTNVGSANLLALDLSLWEAESALRIARRVVPTTWQPAVSEEPARAQMAAEAAGQYGPAT